MDLICSEKVSFKIDQQKIQGYILLLYYTYTTTGRPFTRCKYSIGPGFVDKSNGFVQFYGIDRKFLNLTSALQGLFYE
ncbi:hypothetical protein CM15mP35_03560 [bacterium]|nr:MAG: hypothetical protein CM15mP35_03560 [bacterium]